MAIDRAQALVKKWAPKFGLGDFRLRVTELPFASPEGWGLSYYDLDELWGTVEIVGDGLLPDAVQELLVLHELAHGMLQFAKHGGITEEQSCNRIARLARGDFTTPLFNEHHLQMVGDAEFFGGVDRNSADLDRRAWLPIVTDALPEREREVINGMYWEGLSLREVAERMGIHHHSVERYRDKALERLRKYYDGLERHAARKVIALKEPEGGYEHEVVYLIHHRCPEAALLARQGVLEDDTDLIVLPVGNIGFGMPKGIPFAVQSVDPCGACGRDVGCWFVWQAGSTDHPGEIWTP